MPHENRQIPSRYEVVSPCGFYFYFPITNGVEHPFLYLLVICMEKVMRLRICYLGLLNIFKWKELENWHVQEGLSDLSLKQIIIPSCGRYGVVGAFPIPGEKEHPYL